MKLSAIFLIGPIILTAIPAQALEPFVLHNFTGSANPMAPLVEGPDGNLYGTTSGGGSAGRGTVFSMTPAGIVTTLVNFTGSNGQNPSIVGLIVDGDGNLYGATENGGSGGRGTVFKVTLDGDLTTLVHFNNTNGSNPRGLTMDGDGNLYGTTVTSISGQGTVFKVRTDGAFTHLVTFPSNYGSFPAYLTSGNDGNFYGRTYNGNNGQGKMFRVTPNGILTTLANFSGSPHAFTTALTLGHDGNFYGTTFEGGSNNRGTAFRVTPEGGVTILANFNGTNGSFPAGPLILGNDGDFYGTTVFGGVFEGTIFKMTHDGILTTLANFTSRPNGVRPYAGVIFGPDGSLYGNTITGGTNDSGIIFRVDLPPIIISQPVSRTNEAGTAATFTVATFGTEPFNYQWVKDGVNLLNAGDVSGVNTDTLTLANVQVADEGDFTVVVTNNSGSVTSSVAALTVIVTDTDGDGVLDQDDECPDTASGAVVDEHGCSIEQLVPCEGPRTGGEWKNHGEYVSAVVRVVRRFLTQGMITEQQAGDIVRAAAQSDCGKERNSGRGRGKGLNTRPTPRHSFPVMPRRPF